MEYFISAGNATVHIEDFGFPNENAKTVIFLHGYLETLYIWSQFAESLKDKYRIITMDLPGHGISSTSPDGAPNTMEYCADIVKKLTENFNLQKVFLAGHSMGGFVAMSFAKKYPDSVEKIILFNSHPYPDDASKAKDHDREVSLILGGKLETLASLSIPKMYFPDNLRRVDDKVCETVELCEMHDPAGIVASIRGMQAREDLIPWIKEASKTLPVLAICGDNDLFMPMDKLEQLKIEVPTVKYEVLQNTGHNSFIEDPQKCVDLVFQFVD